MKSIDNDTIICPHCGSTDTRITVLGGDKWLIFCEKCCLDSTISDEELAQAQTAGHMEIKGQPLGGSRKSPTGVEKNPVIRDAESRAVKTQVENPLIKNALKRAGETKTEVTQHV